MLIEFSVTNFRSFKEEQTLTTQACPDRVHSENILRVDGLRLLKTIGIYGANASGKSNLIRAMRLMNDLVTGSATNLNQGDNIPDVAPFRLDPAYRDEPSSFRIKVLLENVIYDYGFSVTTKRVVSEYLSCKGETGRTRKVFERFHRHESDETVMRFHSIPKVESEFLRTRTRENCLLLSRGADLNIPSFSQLFLWFRNQFWYFDLSMSTLLLRFQTARKISEDASLRELVVSFIRDSDVAIDDIHLQEEPMQYELEKMREIFQPTFVDSILEDKDPHSVRVETLHRVASTGSSVKFELSDESNGTQRLFAVAGPLLDAMKKGALVIIDELDASLHPLLVRNLLAFFQSNACGESFAQLVFSTHDVTVMDETLFRRDQIWFADKQQSQASELFSLYDFNTSDRPRSSTSFRKNYLSGRYGAVPNFGPLFQESMNE